MLRHCARILKIDILWCDPHILEGGLDIGVTHQSHERRQAHTGAYHIRGKGVSKPMGVGVTDIAPDPMMTEQRAEAGGSHGLAAPTAFEGDKQRGQVGQWTFQTQIVSEDLKDFRV